MDKLKLRQICFLFAAVLPVALGVQLLAAGAAALAVRAGTRRLF